MNLCYSGTLRGARLTTCKIHNIQLSKRGYLWKIENHKSIVMTLKCHDYKSNSLGQYVSKNNIADI